MLTTVPDGKLLLGDWRHRYGSKTDAHLYHATHGARAGVRLFAEDRPICGKRIKRKDTSPVRKGRPCYECLVAAITGRDYSK